MAESLADRAVATLAHVARMTEGVTNDHPERHALRELKQVAEAILDEAFQHARRLAFASEGLRETMREQERAQADQKGGSHGD